MALSGGSLVEVSLRGHIFGQQQMLVYQYEVDGSFGPFSAVNLGEAWWNHVKGVHRPLVSSSHGAAFESVLVREIDTVGGEYAEWSIPPAEHAGTGATGAGGLTAPFVAAGVRLTVGSGVTRPGQKRISGQDETDTNSGGWETAYYNKLVTWGALISAQMTLGAPVLGAAIDPIVVRKDPTTGIVTVFQPVVGYVVNPNLTTQNTRKIGHGS